MSYMVLASAGAAVLRVRACVCVCACMCVCVRCCRCLGNHADVCCIVHKRMQVCDYVVEQWNVVQVCCRVVECGAVADDAAIECGVVEE